VNRSPAICKRSENCPFMIDADLDKYIVQHTAALARKYAIRFDPQVLVPWDDDLADRVYQAGLELFVELGAYNMSTQRRILFRREEVEAAVAAAPSKVTLGEGKDAVVMAWRGVESPQPCVVHSGPTGTPCSERYHPLILHSCAQESLIDCLGAGSGSPYIGQ